MTGTHNCWLTLPNVIYVCCLPAMWHSSSLARKAGTQTLASSHTRRHTHTQTHIAHSEAHTQAHTHAHSQSHTHTHGCTHAHTPPPYTHTYTHMHTHRDSPGHTHRHTHTHAQTLPRTHAVEPCSCLGPRRRLTKWPSRGRSSARRPKQVSFELRYSEETHTPAHV